MEAITAYTTLDDAIEALKRYAVDLDELNGELTCLIDNMRKDAMEIRVIRDRFIKKE